MNRQRDQRAKSHVVHFTEDIHKPAKTVLPSKASSSLAEQHPNVLPQGNASVGHPRLPQKEGVSYPGASAAYSNPSRRHASVSRASAAAPKSGEWQEPIPSPCCKARALTLRVF